MLLGGLKAQVPSQQVLGQEVGEGRAMACHPCGGWAGME